MNLQERKDLLVSLGALMISGDEEWQAAKRKATAQNAWFIPGFIDLAVNNIARQFLSPSA